MEIQNRDKETLKPVLLRLTFYPDDILYQMAGPPTMVGDGIYLSNVVDLFVSLINLTQNIDIFWMSAKKKLRR